MKAYKYQVWNSDLQKNTEILVIAENEEEAEDKLIDKHRQAGLECQHYLDEVEDYDLVIS